MGGINVGGQENENLKEEEKRKGGGPDFGRAPGFINSQKEKFKGVNNVKFPEKGRVVGNRKYVSRYET